MTRELWEHEKPPLGCCPADIRARERIIEIAEAIVRRASEENPIVLAEWGAEIVEQSRLIENHKYLMKPEKWEAFIAWEREDE